METGINDIYSMCDSLEIKLTSPLLGGMQQTGAAKTAAKICYSLFSHTVGDYKRIDMCLYLIITGFRRKLKIQVNVSHGMNFLTLLTLYTTFD